MRQNGNDRFVVITKAIRNLFITGMVLLLSACSGLGLGSTPTPTTAVQSPIPELAYYYIWYDTSSWNRAKSDYPLLGKYSSDNAQVMLQHILWAKAAGIQGFIVSWKSGAAMNRRLAQLIRLADENNFKLAIIYEGLDFNRNPLPATQVAADLDYFIAHFAGDPAFDIYGKPLVIWSGTWMFTPQQIAGVTQSRLDKLLILASEKNVAGYQRLANLVDGDAYYWSSVDPSTTPGYQQKLDDMAQAIHAHQGLWIAPAASGFDARLVGGTRTISRNNGDTLRAEMNVAIQSSPDAIGLISWNEFSENSEIEPRLSGSPDPGPIQPPAAAASDQFRFERRR
jgi:Glycosyl hydrolase family 99